MEMKVNPLKFLTFHHLNVNYKGIEDPELFPGVKCIEGDLPATVPYTGESPKSVSRDGWDLSTASYVVEENTSCEGGEILSLTGHTAFRRHFHVKKGAKLQYFVVFDGQEDILFSKMTFSLEEGAELRLAPIFLGGSKVFSNILCDILEQDAVVHMESGYYVTKNGEYDLNVEVNHHAPLTKSRLYSRGILDDGGQKTYKYTMDFKPGVEDADGEETEEVVAVTDNFRNVTVPVLLVGEDTISASHGATLTPLEETVLDYIQSRGIPPKEAKKMAIIAKFQAPLDLLSKKGQEVVHRRLVELVREGDVWKG